MGDGSELEAEAADGDGGGALGLADEVGDGDLLAAEALGDADDPFAADGGAWGGRLRDDAAGGDGGGVETILDVETEAEGFGFLRGVGEREAGERWDFDLAAVDGDTHGDVGGEERYSDHGDGAECDVEEAVDARDLHRVSGYIGGGVDTVEPRLMLVSGGCRWRVRGG